MGGPRYEQLFRATGAVRVAGTEHAFTGSGLRIRRQGVRRLEGFWGHCWQSALFPSGRAFGYIAYPPRPDGQPTFNEGYLFAGDGDLIPARVVDAPWLTKLQPLGEDVSVVLQTADGTVRIEGETVLSTSRHHRPQRDSRRPAGQARELDVPRAAAGGGALSMGRRGDLRDARALEPDGQDQPLVDVVAG